MNPISKTAKELTHGEFIVFGAWLLRVESVMTSNTTEDCIIDLTDVTDGPNKPVRLTVHEDADMTVYQIQ